MLERLTDASRTVMRLTAERARAAGVEQMDTGHLLLALIDERGAAAELLATTGVTADRVARLRTTTAAALPAGSRVWFSTEGRRALELSYRRSLGMGQEVIGTEHLLLGVLDVHDGAAVTLLGALEVDLAELSRRAAAKAAENHPAGPTGPDRPVRVPALGTPPRLPSTRALVHWQLASALAYLLLLVPVVVLAPAMQRAAVVFVAIAEPLVLYGLSWLARPLQLRQARRRIGRRGWVRLPAPALAEALAATGVTDPEVYVRTHAVMKNFTYGLGRYGIMCLDATTLRLREVGRFVVAHEAAHLARRDGQRLKLGLCYLSGLFLGGLLSTSVPSLAVALIAALVLLLGAKWSMELACDRIAVRWVGQPAALAWHEFSRALRGRETRTPGRYVRRGTAWLRHPPLRLRRLNLSRVTAVSDWQVETDPVGGLTSM